ncbi:MAG TPA: hypothetical protein VEL05_08990, partial [Candidatus Acidoferrum sp.]|nr:hypothetical protein [Candidatus Acidoferrum sp.]
TRLSEGSFASALATLFAIAAMLAVALPLGVATAGEKVFNMVPSSAAIKACLPQASGEVTIETGDLNDKMEVRVRGLAPNTEYDLFVIEVPNSPFGISWYQSDLQTDENGRGHAKVRGVFDVETFSVSLGGPTVSFPPTHQYHLGLWFNDPQVPFDLGCEPGRMDPAVTPFNGEQHAGIQVLNTGNFPDNAGPLSQIHR